MADIEVPEDLILPAPRDKHEEDLYNALQNAHRQLANALRQLAEPI